MKANLSELIEEGTDDSIATARELLRAAQKHRVELDLREVSDEASGVDWNRLLRRARQPTLSERLLRLVDRFNDVTIARSGFIPAALVAGSFVYLDQYPFRSFGAVAIAAGLAYVVVAVCFLWGVAAYQAYGRASVPDFPPSSVLLPPKGKMRFAAAFPALVMVLIAITPSILGRLHHRNVDERVGEAAVALAEQRYSDALLTFDEASKLLEDDPNLYMTIGKSLHQAVMNLDRDDPKQRKEQDRLARASITYLRRAEALRPSSNEPHVRIAELQYVLGERDAALATIAQIEKRPGVAPGDLVRAGLVLASIAQDEVARLHPRGLTEEERKTCDANLRATIERLNVIRYKTHSPEIMSAAFSLHLMRAWISAEGDRKEIIAQALQETLAADGGGL